jgi:hypothetical protein
VLKNVGAERLQVIYTWQDSDLVKGWALAGAEADGWSYKDVMEFGRDRDETLIVDGEITNSGHQSQPEDNVAEIDNEVAENSGDAVLGTGSFRKPKLLIENNDPDRTVPALRDILANSGELYDRGVPVRLAFDQTTNGIIAQKLTPVSLVFLAHQVCRPHALTRENDGTIHITEGDNQETSTWCEKVPDLIGLIPEKPTRSDRERRYSQPEHTAFTE